MDVHLWKPQKCGQRLNVVRKMLLSYPWFRGNQREYSSKPLKHSIVERILVFERYI